MILSALDSIVTDTTIVPWVMALCIGLSVVFGFGLAFLYKFFKRKKGFGTDLPLSLVLMPIGVCAIVMVSRVIGLESTTARTTLGFSRYPMHNSIPFYTKGCDRFNLHYVCDYPWLLIWLWICIICRNCCRTCRNTNSNYKLYKIQPTIL